MLFISKPSHIKISEIKTDVLQHLKLKIVIEVINESFLELY